MYTAKQPKLKSCSHGTDVEETKLYISFSVFVGI